MSKTKFPKTIFVKWNDAGDGSDPWLETADDAESFADYGSLVEAGEYQLVRVVKVKTEVTIK